VAAGVTRHHSESFNLKILPEFSTWKIGIDETDWQLADIASIANSFSK
jgi:hypothetical protein